MHLKGNFGWVCRSSTSPPTTRGGNLVFDSGNRLSMRALLPPLHVVPLPRLLVAVCGLPHFLCMQRKKIVDVLVFCWNDFKKCKKTFLVLLNPRFFVPSWPENHCRFSPFFCDLKIASGPFPCHSLNGIKVMHSPLQDSPKVLAPFVS